MEIERPVLQALIVDIGLPEHIAVLKKTEDARTAHIGPASGARRIVM